MLTTYWRSDIFPISDKDNQRESFLYAAGEFNCEVMSALLDHGLDVKHVGISAMGRAIEANEVKAVDLLMSLNVPVDPKFLFEAVNKQHASKARTLITHGTPNVTAAQLKLLFCIVIANGSTEVLPAFLERGVDRDPIAIVRALKASANKCAAPHRSGVRRSWCIHARETHRSPLGSRKRI